MSRETRRDQDGRRRDRVADGTRRNIRPVTAHEGLARFPVFSITLQGGLEASMALRGNHGQTESKFQLQAVQSASCGAITVKLE